MLSSTDYISEVKTPFNSGWERASAEVLLYDDFLTEQSIRGSPIGHTIGSLRVTHSLAILENGIHYMSYPVKPVY